MTTSEGPRDCELYLTAQMSQIVVSCQENSRDWAEVGGRNARPRRNISKENDGSCHE